MGNSNSSITEDDVAKVLEVRRCIMFIHRICLDVVNSDKEDAYKYLIFTSRLEYGLENLSEYYLESYGNIYLYIKDVKNGLEDAKNSCDFNSLSPLFK